jgi:hypothetical protein
MPFFSSTSQHVILIILFRVKEVDTYKLKEEYQRLVEGLKDTRSKRETDEIMANPGNYLFVFYEGFYALYLNVPTLDKEYHYDSIIGNA